MTKPTQAQIEAAGAALCNTSCNADCWHEQEPLEVHHWKGLAKAALTAAAEVGEPFDANKVIIPPSGGLTFDGNTGQPVASDVGEPSTSLLSTAIENVKAETIERCAQVAEEHAKRYDLDECLEVAAAIRKLKDE